MINGFDLILEDLKIKGLFVVGGKGSGKTIMGKYLTHLAKEKYGELIDLRCFDPSLAWWHNSPFKWRMRTDSIHNVPDVSDCLYEVGRLESEEFRQLFFQVIGDEYKRRYVGVLEDSDYLNTMPLSCPIVEEAQDVLKKQGLPQWLRVWVNEGRNFKMSGIFKTQRPAEVATGIIERCNLLVGYVEGDNNKQKLKNATNAEFMKFVNRIEPKSHEFYYYNGETYGPIKAEDLYYPSPRDLETSEVAREEESLFIPPELQLEQPSRWWIVVAAIVLWFLCKLFS